MSTQIDQTNFLDPKAQAEIIKNSPAEQPPITLQADFVSVGLRDVGGKFGLDFAYTGSVGRYDYVALCDRDPGDDPYGYLTGQWQYITATSSPYVTGRNFDSSGSYWVMYGSWNYKLNRYVIVTKSNRIYI